MQLCLLSTVQKHIALQPTNVDLRKGNVTKHLNALAACYRGVQVFQTTMGTGVSDHNGYRCFRSQGVQVFQITRGTGVSDHNGYR
jgi:hypothetical protein